MCIRDRAAAELGLGCRKNFRRPARIRGVRRTLSARSEAPSRPHAQARGPGRAGRNLLPLPARPHRARPSGVGRRGHFRALLMALTRTDSAEQRQAILLGLLARNRIVSALRIIVPAAGVAAFLVLVVQIYAASALRQYGVSGIRIDRGALVVDTPDYAGVSKDGARYEARAREARSPLGTPSQIVMHDAAFDFTPVHGSAIHLTAPEATADTERQTLTVPGLATLHGDDGIHGTLTDLVADLQSGMTTGGG